MEMMKRKMGVFQSGSSFWGSRKKIKFPMNALKSGENKSRRNFVNLQN